MRAISRAPANARRALRNALLPATLEHAVRHSRFYERRWQGQAARVRDIDDLPALPIVTKDEIGQNLDEVLCTGESPALVQHTTGTTGEPLHVHRCGAEIRFIQDFFSRTLNGDAKPVPVVLHLADLYHGPSLAIPARAHPVQAGMTDDIHLQEAVRLLSAEHRMQGGERGRVSTIVGLVPYIKTLTNYLIETGFDFTSASVRAICPLCTIVTPRWRNLLSSTWGAAIVDRYSLAEIFGGATRCLACGSFHFDPMVIPEVVDVSSREPIRSGTGTLVLTSLYPFVQMQPMIRYWTGDLVEVSGDSCEPDLSVNFKGRVSSTPLRRQGGRSEIVVCPVDVYHILDELPDINFSDRFVDVSAVRDHSAAGALRFRMRLDGDDGAQRPQLHLEIELRYSPHLYADRCSQLRTHIAAELERRSALLASGEISLDVQFFAPSSIPPFSLKI